MLSKLEDISSGLDAVNAKTAPDNKDRLENEDASKQQAKYLSELIEDLKSYRELRRNYGDKVFKYLIGYSSFCAIVLILQGWRIFWFHLNDYVVGILVGSTAVAALGLVGFVVQGLFKPKVDKNSQKSAKKDKKPADD